VTFTSDVFEPAACDTWNRYAVGRNDFTNAFVKIIPRTYHPLMPRPLTAADVLQREYLDIRHRLLDIAASLDRIERGSQSDAIRIDPRLTQIYRALALLAEERTDRTVRMQMIFSDAYVPNWRDA